MRQSPMLVIVSGGQTGVDRAALDAALRLGVPADGWCPRGRLAEDGPLADFYPLRETPTARYPERTEWNVRDTDGTLLLTFGKPIGGTDLTVRMVKKHRRPSLRLDLANPLERWGAAKRIAAWIEQEQIVRLNVAGPRASTSPGVYRAAYELLRQLLRLFPKAALNRPLKFSSPKKKSVPRTTSGDALKPAREEKPASGDEGSRTLDLSIANAALCQLSYVPGNESVGLSPATGKHSLPTPAPWTDANTRLVQKELPRWFARFARELPWRETRDPYRIWVSEIMLQQTTVTAVKPFYERFLARFPTIESLAFSQEEEVLRLWEGLGYYSRGRNLRKAAIMLVEQFEGALPCTIDELRRLPGIGRYVAGAVASFAFGKRAAIVEANTLRLYCRLLGFEGDPRNSTGQEQLWSFAESLLPMREVGDFNQALMDLGSTVCTPKNPACPRCPLLSVCRAAVAGSQDRIPQKAKRPEITDVTELTVAVLHEDRVLLRRRGPDERWAGMWDFPRFACEAGEKLRSVDQLAKLARSQLRGEYGVEVRDLERVLEVKHAVTRYRIHLHGFQGHVVGRSSRLEELIKANSESNLRWVACESLGELPLSVTARQLAVLLSSANV